MKILYIITKSSWGGAQRHVFDLVNEFKDMHDIIVVFGKNNFSAKNFLKNKLKETGISFIEIASLNRNINLGKDIKALHKILNIIKKEKPDIIHSHSSKAGFLGMVAARVSRVKGVFTVHGSPHKEKRGILSKMIITFLTWFSIFLSRKSIVVSLDDYDTLRKWPFLKKKIHYIPNGVDTSKCISSRVQNKMIVIGSVAELTKNKSIESTLNVLSFLKKDGVDFKYIHAGDGELREELLIKAKELKIDNEVSFLGFVDDVHSFLQRIDVFVLPSIKEGLPYVVLEAICAGVPVVARSVGELPHILEDTPELLFNTDDEFVKRIKDIINNKPLQKDIVDMLQYNLKKNYSISNIKNTKELYSK